MPWPAQPGEGYGQATLALQRISLCICTYRIYVSVYDDLCHYVICISLSLYIYIHKYTNMCVCIYIYIHTHVYTHIYIYIYTLYIYIYIYIHMRAPAAANGLAATGVAPAGGSA